MPNGTTECLAIPPRKIYRCNYSIKYLIYLHLLLLFYSVFVLLLNLIRMENEIHLIDLVLWCLMPLPTIFQGYRGGHCYWWWTRKKLPTCRESLTSSIIYCCTPRHNRQHMTIRTCNDLLNIHIKLISRKTNPTGGELRCFGKVSSSCSTSDTSRVNLVAYPVISHE